MIDKRYQRAWSNLRFRESLRYVIAGGFQIFSLWPVVAFVPLFLISERLLARFGVVSITLQVLLSTALFFVPCAVLLYPTYSFRCPRCLKLFFVTRLGIPLKLANGKRCPHCGLERETGFFE